MTPAHVDEFKPQEEIRISLRALAGTNADDLYLIPSCLNERDEFSLSAASKFVRCRGGVYVFIRGSWERKDGTLCEEEPGMMYAMGHVAEVLPK